MNTNQKNTGWGFWLAWVLVSIIGFSVGMLLGIKVAYGLFDRNGFDVTLGITMVRVRLHQSPAQMWNMANTCLSNAPCVTEKISMGRPFVKAAMCM